MISVQLSVVRLTFPSIEHSYKYIFIWSHLSLAEISLVLVDKALTGTLEMLFTLSVYSI